MKITQTFTNAPGGTIFFNLAKRDFTNIQNNADENHPQPKRRRLNDNVDQVIVQEEAEVADGENDDGNVDEVIVNEVAQHQFNANGPIPQNFQARVLLQRINNEPQQPQQRQQKIFNQISIHLEISNQKHC